MICLVPTRIENSTLSVVTGLPAKEKMLITIYICCSKYGLSTSLQYTVARMN